MTAHSFYEIFYRLVLTEHYKPYTKIALFHKFMGALINSSNFNETNLINTIVISRGFKQRNKATRKIQKKI